MKYFRKISTILTSIAIVLVVAAGVQSSYAYFTTYAESEGGETVRLVHSEEIYEEVEDLSKSIRITNNAEKSQPVFVRARAYVGSMFEEYFSYTPDAGWSDGGDGWWYYEEVLDPGESTSTLVAALSEIPEELMNAYQNKVNVVVVFESTLALYEYQGDGIYKPFAYWGDVLDEGQSSQGGSES